LFLGGFADNYGMGRKVGSRFKESAVEETTPSSQLAGHSKTLSHKEIRDEKRPLTRKGVEMAERRTS